MASTIVGWCCGVNDNDDKFPHEFRNQQEERARQKIVTGAHVDAFVVVDLSTVIACLLLHEVVGRGGARSSKSNAEGDPLAMSDRVLRFPWRGGALFRLLACEGQRCR